MAEAGPHQEVTAEVATATDEGTFHYTARPNVGPASAGFAGVHNQVARRTV
jgi:hypothetical protein